jgi:hypothetical protein
MATPVASSDRSGKILRHVYLQSFQHHEPDVVQFRFEAFTFNHLRLSNATVSLAQVGSINLFW